MTASRTGSSSIRSSTSWKKPRTISRSASGRFRPRLACVESQGSTRQRIIDYFVRHGFTIVGKYVHVDKANLYFAPLS